MSLNPPAPPNCTDVPELMNLISDTLIHLPPFQYSRLASSEIDYYGASTNIARSLGLPSIPYTRASWLHGWMQYPLTRIELLARDEATVCCDPKAVPNLVATTEQELFIKDHGYKYSKAVGLPFIYTKKTQISRIPGSLLLMPAHTLKESNANYKLSKKHLLPENLSDLRKKFSLIVACLGGFCVQRGNYVESYENYGIPWVTGAWLHDAFALQRLRNLFSQFEYVATDSIGSHIPYAGYCGCKVIYYGKGKKMFPEDFAEVPFYQKYPHLIDIVIHEQKLETIQKRFPILFNNDSKSEALKTWSMAMLGAKNQIAPNEIAELIGWKIRPKDENSWEYIPVENPGLQ
jgi:hypothetical protein